MYVADWFGAESPTKMFWWRWWWWLRRGLSLLFKNKLLIIATPRLFAVYRLTCFTNVESSIRYFTYVIHLHRQSSYFWDFENSIFSLFYVECYTGNNRASSVVLASTAFLHSAFFSAVLIFGCWQILIATLLLQPISKFRWFNLLNDKETNNYLLLNRILNYFFTLDDIYINLSFNCFYKQWKKLSAN